MHKLPLILLVFALVLSSCSLLPVPRLEVQQPAVNEAKISQISAGDLNQSCVCDIKTGELTTTATLTIRNNGGGADRLVKVESDAATRIELRKAGSSQDLTSLEPVDGIDIPANGQVTFAQGQYAMVIMGIKQDLKPGEKVNFSLFFEKSGKLDAAFEVIKK